MDSLSAHTGPLPDENVKMPERDEVLQKITEWLKSTESTRELSEAFERARKVGDELARRTRSDDDSLARLPIRNR